MRARGEVLIPAVAITIGRIVHLFTCKNGGAWPPSCAVLRAIESIAAGIHALKFFVGTAGIVTFRFLSLVRGRERASLTGCLSSTT